MPLQPPCAADELGNLFNKEAVVQALLAKNMPRGLAHLTSMKHLIDIKLEESQGTAADAAVRFACPVTGLPMSGKSKFVIIRKEGQGYVVSERAIKELPLVVKEIVGGDWTVENVLPVYPQGEELEKRQEMVTARREAELAEKLEKKTAKAAAKGVKNGTTYGSIKRSDVGNGGLAEGSGAGNGNGASKRAKKSAAEELMPSNADAKVWNSLFTNKEKEAEAAKGQKSKGNTDYMVRGQLKYVA
jgi:Rtf2 RING-finger